MPWKHVRLWRQTDDVSIVRLFLEFNPIFFILKWLTQFELTGNFRYKPSSWNDTFAKLQQLQTERYFQELLIKYANQVKANNPIRNYEDKIYFFFSSEEGTNLKS